MKINFDNIGGLRLGSNGTLYQWGRFRKSSNSCAIYAERNYYCFCPSTDLDAAFDASKPKLQIAPGRVWLDVWIPTDTDGHWTRGGYLGTKTVDFKFTGGALPTSGVTLSQNYLAVIPGPYTGGIRVDGIDSPPNQWTKLQTPDFDGVKYDCWAEIGTFNGHPLAITSGHARLKHSDHANGSWLYYFVPAIVAYETYYDIP